MKRACTFLCLVLASFAARAERVDVNLSDETLRGTYEGPLTGRLGGNYDLGVLLGDSDDGSFQQVHAGLLVTGDAGARDATVTAGLGGRVFLINGGPDADGGGLALGGMVDVRLPAFNRVGIIAYGYGAPDASTFGDFDGWFEYAASADYQVLKGASVYLGWRQLKLDLDGAGMLTVDTGWHVGLRLNF
ncbi:MAG: YfaZ family outer membrane protein [Nevskiaceae bacterium]